MSVAYVENRKHFIALLGFALVFATAPSAWSSELADDTMRPENQMLAHAEEALHASRDRKDLKEATKHTDMAIEAGKKVKTSAKGFSEGLEKLTVALTFAKSGNQEKFEMTTIDAIVAIAPQKKPCSKGESMASQGEVEISHGDGCIPAACGCVAALTTCDRFHPNRKCTPAGCNCYCM